MGLLIKKESTGMIGVYNYDAVTPANSLLINTLQPSLSVAVRGANIEITLTKTLLVQTFIFSEVVKTQIGAAPIVNKPATIQELATLLKDSFFNGTAGDSAPLPADAATLTEQQVQTTILQGIASAQAAAVNITSQIYEDAASNYVFAVATLDSGGVPTFEYFNTAGTPVVPTFPLTPIAGEKQVQQVECIAIATGTGYTLGDLLLSLLVLDLGVVGYNPVSFFFNLSTNTVIAPPPSSDYTFDEAIDMEISEALGDPADAAVTNPASTASQIAIQKGLLTLIAAMSAKLPAVLGRTTMEQSLSVVQANEPATYAMGLTNYSTGGASTDVLVIRGSATKTIKVKHISVTGNVSGGSGSLINVQMIRRTAANTGGAVSGTPAVVKFDSNNDAATAVVSFYTSPPTVGAGTVFMTEKVFMSPTNGDSDLWTYETPPNAQEFTLRGTGEYLAINLNGANLPSLNVDITWSEE